MQERQEHWCSRSQQLTGMVCAAHCHIVAATKHAYSLHLVQTSMWNVMLLRAVNRPVILLCRCLFI